MQIDYKSFYLRPDTPEEGIVRKPREGSEPGTLLTGRLGDAATEAGLTMRRAPITPNTRLAFEASEFAKDEGLFEQFHDVCYEAFWEEGVNLGDLSVLQMLGERVGLDAQKMKDSLDTAKYTAQAVTQYEEALGLGIRGIPSFIMGKYLFSGAQPYEVFKNVAEKVQSEAANGDS